VERVSRFCGNPEISSSGITRMGDTCVVDMIGDGYVCRVGSEPNQLTLTFKISWDYFASYKITILPFWNGYSSDHL